MNPNAPTPDDPSLEPFVFPQMKDQLQAWIWIEEECNCDIGAGRDWGTQSGAFVQDPQGVEALARLRDWLLGEFRLMLIEWDLGVVTDIVHPTARSLLIERLRQPSLEMQQQLWRWFEQAQAGRTDPSAATTADANEARMQVRRLMLRSLGEADWQALRQAATTALDHYLAIKLSQMHPPQ